MPTIIKQHLPAFEGDAPKDWVPGSRLRFKSNHPTLRSSFSKWYKDEYLSITGMKVLWLEGLLYEYEVEDKMTIATYTPKFNGDCPPDYEIGCKTWDIIGGDPIKNYRDPSWHEGASYRYYAKEKQPAVKPEKFWIVWRPGSRGTNPSRRHPTEQMAKQEAESLSKTNPNIEFIVLEAKSCCKSTAHVTTESQEYE